MTDGIQLDNFKANPVIIYYHELGRMPIGRWENIRKENGKLLADPVFDEKDPIAMEVKRKYDEKFIHAASIGFLPLSFSEDPEHLLPGQAYPTVMTCDAFEASFCSIPVNPGATATLSLLKNKKELGIAPLTAPAPNKSKSNMKEIAKTLGLPDTATEQDIVAKIEADKRKSLSVQVETVIAEGRRKGVVNDANAEHYRTLGVSNLDALKSIVSVAAEPVAPAAPATDTVDADKPATSEAKTLSLSETIRQALLDGGKKPETKELSFDDLQKTNPTELRRLKAEEPEKYKALALAYANSKKVQNQ